MTTRIVSIQWLRAVAAMLLVLPHVAASIVEGSAPVDGRLAPAVWQLALMSTSGVNLFFVISGIVMAQTLATGRTTPGAFLIARWRRIVPVFVMVSAVYMALSAKPAVLPAIVSTITILPVMDADIYHAPMLTVGWTLGLEFAFYAIVASVMAAERRSPLWLGALALAAALAGTIAHPAWAPLRLLLNLLQAEFAIGVFAWHAWRHAWTRLGVALIVAGAAGLVLAATRDDLYDLAFFQNAISGNSGWRRTFCWGLPWAMIATAMLDIGKGGRASDPVAALGDASYALYLIHPCVVLAAERLRGTLTLGVGTYAVAVVMLSVGLALAFHRWIERPLLASGARAVRRGQQPQPA